MRLTSLISLSLFGAVTAGAQAGSPQGPALPASTAIPVVFTKSVDANHVKVGDIVLARTTQNIVLESGRVIPSGAKVTGHVVTGSGFTYDKTPYAKQKEAALGVHFDSLESQGTAYPITVYLRALADPISSWGAVKPRPSDEDPEGTTTQIGGDIVDPHQSEIRSQGDDVVGYNKRDGAHAHLIAAQGNSPEGCDATDTEQAMSIFSASACGLYGFPDTRLVQSGRHGAEGTFLLESHKQAPKIYAHSNALLEVTTGDTHVAAR
jgi:hypothetical protein